MSLKREPSIINKISRQMNKNEAEFRVHFFLLNVYCENLSNLPSFLNNINRHMERSCRPVCIQVAKLVDHHHVNLSVGLDADTHAMQLIVSEKAILLPYKEGMKDFLPVPSSSFKYYIEKNKASLSKIRLNVSRQSSIYASKRRRDPRSYDESDDSDSSMRRQSKRYRYRDRSSSEGSGQRSKGRSSLKQSQQSKKSSSSYKLPQIYTVWIFCIPLQFRERDIDNLFASKNIYFKSRIWKMKQDMEYLEVELQQPVPASLIAALELKIDRYPLIVIPKKSYDGYFTEELLRYELEVNFDRDQDEIEIIKFAQSLDGIIFLIKDEFYAPRRYIFVANNPCKFNAITNNHPLFKHSKISKPKVLLRLGRMDRSFTFAQIAENTQFGLSDIASSELH